jgi:ABC-type transport system substrate-binding protein
MRTLTKGRFAGLATSLLMLPAMAGTAVAQEETVLRVAMTAADIPTWTGSPDQGYEGYRFVGYTLYDALTLWDLSKSDVAAEIVPGLATSWEIDPEDNQRWIFYLREGVTYHDGCPFDADSVIWNFARVQDDTSPQFNERHKGMSGWAIVNVSNVERIDDHTVAISTSVTDSMLPYELANYFMISNCAVEAAGNDYTVYAEAPAGTGPYKFDTVVPHERLELIANTEYWNPDRVPQHDRLVLIPMPEASTRAAALLSGQVDFVEAPSPDTIPRLEAAGMQIIKVPYPHNWNYQLDVNTPPFDDIASVRPPITP